MSALHHFLLGGIAGLGLTPGPSPSSPIELSFSWSLDVERVGGSVEVSFEDEPLAFDLPWRSWSEDRTVELLDEPLEAVDGGAIPGIRRSFVSVTAKLAGSWDEGASSHAHEAKGILDGACVLFTWDEELGAYVPEMELEARRGGFDLTGLEPDLSFDALRPEPDAAVDDRWELDPALVLLVCDAGGAALFDADDQESFAFPTWLGATASRELTARYGGRDEVDGVELELVTLRGRVRISPTDEVVYGPVAGGLGYVEGDNHTTRRIELDVEGEARWDPGAGRLWDLTLRAELAVELECVGSSDGLVHSTLRESLAGTLQAEVSVR